MSKYITDSTNSERKEVFLLAQAYEDAQNTLLGCIRAVDEKIYKPDSSNFDSAESISNFKKIRPGAHAGDYNISVSRRKLQETSKALDEWLTSFIVNKLDTSSTEFVLCGDYKEGIIIIRVDKTYHIIHCTGKGPVRDQLGSYLRDLKF